MGYESYLNKRYIDEKGKQYIATEIADSSSDYVLLGTNTDYYIKILLYRKNIEEEKQKIEFLKNISKRKSEVEDGVIVECLETPISFIINLKYNEIGFTLRKVNDRSMFFFIDHNNHFSYKWYFEETHSLGNRLKMGAWIAKRLAEIFSNGMCLGNICPQNVTWNIEKPFSGIEFVNCENLIHKTQLQNSRGVNGYFDPLVYLGRKLNSSYSDTYSYAIMLFEILTTCHPFKGNQYESLEKEEADARLNAGELQYIGIADGDNYNDFYDDEANKFIPKELKDLFQKIFVTGKFSEEDRPKIEDFYKACMTATYHLQACTNSACGREFLVEKKNIKCPYCGRENSFFTASISKVIEPTEKVLLPYKKIRGLTALDEIAPSINYIILKDGLNNISGKMISDHEAYKDGTLRVTLNRWGRNVKLENNFNDVKIKIKGESPLLAHQSRMFYFDRINITSDGVLTLQILDASFESDHYGTVNIYYRIEIKEGTI